MVEWVMGITWVGVCMFLGLGAVGLAIGESTHPVSRTLNVIGVIIMAGGGAILPFVVHSMREDPIEQSANAQEKKAEWNHEQSWR